jgi:NADH-quinone oxidoreductase subunit L
MSCCPINILLLPIVIPLAAGVLTLLLPRALKGVKELLALVATGATLYYAWVLFQGGADARLIVPWTSFGIDFDLYAPHFARFIVLAAAGFQVLLALYSASFMSGKWRSKEFFAYLLFTAGLTNGAVLSNNFVVLLFFWESLLVTLYGMISIGSPRAHPTATKAFIISGAADFLMFLGILLAWKISGTFTMSDIHLDSHGLGAAAFVLMSFGAMAKAGAMPFHTWIPDAALDAPLPFMAYLPAALEKLLGIYMLGRISLEFFTIHMNSALSIFLMSIGAITIVFPVLMALVQKDYKRLLSFHAISQVGYMILGIGTGTAIGIAGGLFHMLNHAMYKCTLFLSGGAVEKQTGTTDLSKLGGLFKAMPITALCFGVAALSISGVPPFNGFVSKEMVFHGAWETGHPIFAVAAWLGAIFTFASFLKLGHSAYFGKRSLDMPTQKPRESNLAMLIPMLVIAGGCILFGVKSEIPLKHFIEPILAGKAVVEGPMEFWHHAFDFNWIVGVSMGCLLIAFVLHVYGFAKSGGKAYLASEPVHNLPVAHKLYDWAEADVFDIYNWFFTKTIRGAAATIYVLIDRGIDAIYEKLLIFVGQLGIGPLKEAHNGIYANYLAWVIGGFVIVAWVLVSATVK